MKDPLKLADLSVESFATTADPAPRLAAAVTVVTIDTEQIECWSPLCMDTEQRTCPPAA